MKKLILGMILLCNDGNIVRTKSVAVTGPKYTSSEQLAQGKLSSKIPATGVTNYQILQNTTIRDG
jgi:hypothetical protein